jgi:hypothetical protein
MSMLSSWLHDRSSRAKRRDHFGRFRSNRSRVRRHIKPTVRPTHSLLRINPEICEIASECASLIIHALTAGASLDDFA